MKNWTHIFISIYSLKITIKVCFFKVQITKAKIMEETNETQFWNHKAGDSKENWEATQLTWQIS